MGVELFRIDSFSVLEDLETASTRAASSLLLGTFKRLITDIKSFVLTNQIFT